MQLTRLATAGASLSLLLLAGFTSAQASEKPMAAACESADVTLYPGSWLGPRYGEWNMHIIACPDKNPSTWKKNSGVELNAVASNLGMNVHGDPVVRTTETGENQHNRFGRYEAIFQTRTCVPYVGWPCRGPFVWKAQFTVTADKKTKQVNVHLQGRTTPAPTLVLYDTP